MAEKLMLLPSSDPDQARLVVIPDDYEQHEAYRLVTGLIAGVEQQDMDYDWQDVADVLEERGFTPVECVLGPQWK